MEPMPIKTQQVGNKNLQESKKDKELTKLVVNELHRGTEVIGDKNTPSISNITFTADNDTVTAMAFIAGNLLNRLWNMEKEADEDSLETEILKQEKLADLMELFKQPMSLRQESVLKSALEKLSDVMSTRNPQNISICEEINQVKNMLTPSKNITNAIQKPNNTNKSQFKVVDKMKTILDQLEKFENLRKTLDNLKEVKQMHHQFEKKENSVETGSEIEGNDASLNKFGDIFSKVTKLLLPGRSAKRMKHKISTQNFLKNNPKVSEKVKSLFGIDISNQNLTAKDHFVMDYLDKMERNPGCLLGKKNIQPSPIQKVESDILLNLSEFFKMKSFTDLLKLMDDTKKNQNKESAAPEMGEAKNDLRKTNIATTEKPETTTSIIKADHPNKSKNDSDFENVKLKLKEHLKALLEDLKEIQNKSMAKNDLHIAAALPCLYNFLNSDATNFVKRTHKSIPSDEIDDNDYPSRRRNYNDLQMSDLVNDIKTKIKESPANAPSRRNLEIDILSKYELVWNRVLKNIHKINFRRKNNEAPQEDLSKIIDRADSLTSNVFKNIAILTNVHPADHLMLLKALQVDVKKYITVFEKILQSKNPDPKPFKNGDINEFVQNADINIKLNGKVLSALNKLRRNRTLAQYANLNLPSSTKPSILKSSKLSESFSNINKETLKITRDQIATQLIRNRLRVYCKLKESSGLGNLAFDTNYKLARRVLLNIDNGNLNEAKDLFKTLLSRKEQNTGVDLVDKRLAGIQNNPLNYGQDPFASFNKERVPQFDERSIIENQPLSYQNALIKQLLNIKNM